MTLVSSAGRGLKSDRRLFFFFFFLIARCYAKENSVSRGNPVWPASVQAEASDDCHRCARQLPSTPSSVNSPKTFMLSVIKIVPLQKWVSL